MSAKRKSRKNDLQSLNEHLERGDVSNFLMCLRKLISEEGGFKDVSATTKLHRVSLHKMLSSSGNPTLMSLVELLTALNLKLEVNRINKL